MPRRLGRKAAALKVAASGTGASTTPRTGFVSLAPGAGLPVRAQAATAAGPDRILEDLAAQITASKAAHPTNPAIITRSGHNRDASISCAGTASHCRPDQGDSAAAGEAEFRCGSGPQPDGAQDRAAIAAFQQSQDLPVTLRPLATPLEALRTAALPPRWD